MPLISVAFCSPAESLTFSGLMENPFVGEKLESEHPSNMHQSYIICLWLKWKQSLNLEKLKRLLGWLGATKDCLLYYTLFVLSKQILSSPTAHELQHGLLRASLKRCGRTRADGALSCPADGQSPFRTTLKQWLKPMFVGICKEIGSETRVS